MIIYKQISIIKYALSVTIQHNKSLESFIVLLYLYVFAFQYVKELFYLVENKGVEPLTSCVQSRRSSQLS